MPNSPFHPEHRLRQSLPTFGIAFAIILIAGCSQSKEDKALERIAKHKPPAYVRLINYGVSDATMLVKGRPIDVKAHTPGAFQITSSGKQKITVKSDGKTLFDSEVLADSGTANSVVICPKGAKYIIGDRRDADPGQSAVRVILVTPGTNVSVKADDAKLMDQVDAESGSETLAIKPGHHKFVVKSSDGKMVEVEGDFSAGDVYSVIVEVKVDGATAVIVNNSPVRHPGVQSHMAGAG